jgi:hypothetical protein
VRRLLRKPPEKAGERPRNGEKTVTSEPEPEKSAREKGYHGAKVGDTVHVTIGGGQDAEVRGVNEDGGLHVKLPKGIPGNPAYPSGSFTHPEKHEITQVNGKAVAGEPCGDLSAKWRQGRARPAHQGTSPEGRADRDEEGQEGPRHLTTSTTAPS